MIVAINGQLISKLPPTVEIACANGLCYELTVSMNTVTELPDIGQPISLHTHYVVREDAHSLYGFSQAKERELFRHLLKANGVGPKSAITLLSSISVAEFVQCVHAQDIARLVKLPGIGKKTAERLLIEMRDRLSDWIAEDGSIATASSLTASSQDAVSALLALGYKAAQVNRVMRHIDTKDKDTEAIIKAALKLLAESEKRGVIA